MVESLLLKMHFLIKCLFVAVNEVEVKIMVL